jgi:outer membrane protein
MIRKQIVFAVALAAALTPAAAQEVKVGVFDSQKVWEQTDEGKKLRGMLETFRDSKLAEINAKETELAKLRDRLREQELSLSDEKKGAMLKDIDQKSIDLKRLNDDATREMKIQFNDAQEQFQKELFQVVEALGKEKKYALILEKTIVIYSDPATDITPEVTAKFNLMFKGPPAPAANTGAKPGGGETKKPAPQGSKPSGGGR